MADAERPTKRQRLNAEYSNAELDNMCCSICAEPFVDPVSLRGSGHTYCRACITQALANQRRCPLSNARITIPRRGGVDGVLDPNHQVRSMMDAQRVACAHASRGCTERPKLGDVEAHEASCAFAPKKCARCPFLGSRAETEAHERSCPYVVLGPLLDAQTSRIHRLERRVTEQDRTNERLTARLDALEQSNRRTVTPASARRTAHAVVEHTDLRWAHGGSGIVLSKERRAVHVPEDAGGNGYFSADALASFDTGTHAWTLLVTKTDGYMGVGVSYKVNGTRIEFYLYVKGNVWNRDSVDDNGERDAEATDLAKVDAPWGGDNFKAGSVLNVTFDCETGRLSVGLVGSDCIVSHQLDESASKCVSPMMFLDSGNACEFVGDGAVVPARRPPRDVGNVNLAFDPSRCENSIELSEDGTLAEGDGRAIALSNFNSGAHAWRLHFPETDGYIGVGVCTGDTCYALSLMGSHSGGWRRVEMSSSNTAWGDVWRMWFHGRSVAEANVPWLGHFGAGSTLQITYNCGSGELIVEREGSPGLVRRTFSELASKRVSPFVFLTSNNTCKIGGGGAIVPAIFEHRGLTFDAGRCIGVDLSGGDKYAVGHGDAVASEVFDSGKHLWKLRFPVTDRMVGVGICTEDRDLGVALNPSAHDWFTGEVNGESWYSRREVRRTHARIPWHGEEFEHGSVLDVSFDCDTGALSVGLAGSDGVASLVIDELVSKRVSPFVFLTHGNCCEFVD
jgi:hypothetical protein